jgi:hypothetical protein
MIYSFTMIVVLNIFVNGSTIGINAQALNPIIDCNGDINCPGPIPVPAFTAVINKSFWFGSCIVTPRFEYTKCCNGGPCQYVVKLIGIDVIGNCTQHDMIKKESLKFIMAYLPQLVGIEPMTSFVLHYSQPKCMSNETQIWHGMVITNMLGCTPVDCCLESYNLLNMGTGVRVINEGYYANNPVQCSTSPSTCSYTCNTLDLTPDLNLDIVLGDYETPDIYWKLEGNDNVTNQNFIGPTNGEDFVIKTFNNYHFDLMDRIRVHNDYRIDFNLNTWGKMPQISFDAVESPSLFEHDPTIKLYRQTGATDIDGVYPSYPWWISVNAKNGTNGWGAFNIWSCNDAELTGTEDPQMVRKFSILRNGNVGIGVDEPAEKLVVDGTICAKEVKVSITGPCWPDYVFDDGYELIPLNILESMIRERRALPGIPKAEDIDKYGVELGDMQAKLLQKIEEMTLYLIELEKKNQGLEQRLQKLEGK